MKTQSKTKIKVQLTNKRYRNYVPPTPPAVSDEIVLKGSSQTAEEAPKLAAKREALTPPLPAPIVNRSKSYLAPLSEEEEEEDSARIEKFRRRRRWR